MADLAARLVQEAWQLGSVELRRLGVEVQHRRKYAGRALVALILGGTFAAAATAALATAVLLYLGQRWSNYAAGALATGVLLLLMAVAAGCILVASARRLSQARAAGGTTAKWQERSAARGA